VYFTNKEVWTNTLELPAGDYYIVLRATYGTGWTTDNDVNAGNTPRLMIYSNDCHQFVGSYTFGMKHTHVFGV
jgi:hypothetical protein